MILCPAASDLRRTEMTTSRTHFAFRVDTWSPDGESIVEHVTGIDDYQVALSHKWLSKKCRSLSKKRPHRPARRRAAAHAPQDAGNEPGATGRCARHHLPASAEKRDRHQSHRSGPVAANLPHPAGAGSFLLRGRTKCSSATRLQWKRVIAGRG